MLKLNLIVIPDHECFISRRYLTYYSKMSTRNVSIIITSYNDPRILDLVEKLTDESILEIIIADGGSGPQLMQKLDSISDDRVRVLVLPGSVAETRRQVQDQIKGEIAVFIDTDEMPCEGWLDRITEPILKNEADFVFGPTKPFRTSDNRITFYIDRYDQWFYENILPADISKGAMGNSAWRAEIFHRVFFNPKLTMGGEDYDFTLQALNRGYKGAYAKDAFVYHDQGSINTLRKFMKKKFRYMVGASIAYRDNGSLMSGIGKSSRNSRKFDDPLEILVLIMKPLALFCSMLIFPRICRRKSGRNPSA